jgi:anthranilate phosphoribosyltransferase
VPLRQKNKQNENILNRLINHEMLTAAEEKRSWSISLMAVITQVKSLLLTVFMMRSISIEELGFRDALLELCIRVDLSDYNTIDHVEQAVTEKTL